MDQIQTLLGAFLSTEGGLPNIKGKVEDALPLEGVFHDLLRPDEGSKPTHASWLFGVKSPSAGRKDELLTNCSELGGLADGVGFGRPSKIRKATSAEDGTPEPHSEENHPTAIIGSVEAAYCPIKDRILGAISGLKADNAQTVLAASEKEELELGGSGLDVSALQSEKIDLPEANVKEPDEETALKAGLWGMANSSIEGHEMTIGGQAGKSGSGKIAQALSRVTGVESDHEKGDHAPEDNAARDLEFMIQGESRGNDAALPLNSADSERGSACDFTDNPAVGKTFSGKLKADTTEIRRGFPEQTDPLITKKESNNENAKNQVISQMISELERGDKALEGSPGAGSQPSSPHARPGRIASGFSEMHRHEDTLFAGISEGRDSSRISAKASTTEIESNLSKGSFDTSLGGSRQAPLKVSESALSTISARISGEVELGRAAPLTNDGENHAGNQEGEKSSGPINVSSSKDFAAGHSVFHEEKDNVGESLRVFPKIFSSLPRDDIRFEGMGKREEPSNMIHEPEAQEVISVSSGVKPRMENGAGQGGNPDPRERNAEGSETRGTGIKELNMGHAAGIQGISKGEFYNQSTLTDPKGDFSGADLMRDKESEVNERTDLHVSGLEAKRESSSDMIGRSERPTTGNFPQVDGETKAETSAANIQRISSAIRYARNNPGEIRLQLRPASLGHLQINISSVEESTVSVRIIAENPVSRDLIEKNVGELRSELRANGIEMEKCEVLLTDDPSRDSAGGRRFTAHESHGRIYDADKMEEDLHEKGTKDRNYGRHNEEQGLSLFA